MKRYSIVGVFAAALALALTGGVAQARAAHVRAGATPAGTPQHIFYIMMENHGYAQIIGNTADAPYINNLATHNGLELSYFGVTHPSLPNYLAAVSGDFQGIWDDCKAGADIFCAPEEFIPDAGDGTAGDYLTPEQIASASATAHLFAGHNIVDQLEANGLSWRAYMQSLPETGSQVEYWPVVDTATGPVTVKLYAQKHNPFMYFSDINSPGNPRLNGIVPFEGNFASDLASGHVPNFVWISPDQCHDMHGVSTSNAALIALPKCGFPDSGLDHGAIQLGDRFLRKTVREITSSSTWNHSRSAIVITWDEDDYSGFAGCCGSPTGVGGVTLGGSQVPTIVLTSYHKGYRTLGVSANHYSLLATIESMWHLGCLANSCSIPSSGLLTPLFAK
jgi:hypothetical protein